LDDINERVTLLAIYKKEPNEQIDDTIKSLANNGLFDIKGGKKIVENLQKSSLIDSNYNLTFIGEAKAREVEQEFKI
jgi:hypothetical protein